MMTEYSKVAGIYKLTCLTNGKIYIGKSIDLKRRMRNHRDSKIIPNKKYKIASAIVKYGWDSFSVEILEIFENFNKMNIEDVQLLFATEAKYIEVFDSTNTETGYNICKHSTDRTGHVCSEESRQRMSKAQKKVVRIFDEDERKRLRDIRLGKKMSPEAREKISRATKGRKHSEETKAKMRIAQSNRKPYPPISDETRKRMSQSQIGKRKPPITEETREKLRTSHLGQVCSEETREKLKNANTGRKHTAEELEKMRQANLGKKHSDATKEKMRRIRLENKLKLHNGNES